MRCLTAFLTMLMTTALLGHTSSDAAAVWNMNASSCRANDTAIQGSWYQTDDYAVGYRPGDVSTTSTITMYCPVLAVHQDPFTGDGSTINFLGLFGRLNETGTSITAQLIRVSKNTGALSKVGDPVTLLHPAVGDWLMRKTSSVIHQFDFAHFFYYVRVDISRTDSTHNVFFHAVDLSVGSP